MWVFRCKRARNGRSSARAAALERELEATRSGPQTYESRIERFDLLWYPAVTYSPRERLVTKAASGVPYCKRCVAALKGEGREWACPKCGERRPDTVADTMVTESIEKEAVKQFLERRPDYRFGSLDIK